MSSAGTGCLDSGPETAAPGTGLRILCLGNDLLADDSLGSVVAERVRQLGRDDAEVVFTSETGFHLLDSIVNAARLVVVDTVLTGTAPPGTIYVTRESELRMVSGGSPHYIGLLETLALARALGLQVPNEVVILAVEAADCLTVGGEMHPAVRASVPRIVNMIRERVFLRDGDTSVLEADSVTP